MDLNKVLGNKPSKKDYLRMKLRQKIQSKQNRRMRKENIKFQYQNMPHLDLDIETLCRHMILDVSKYKKSFPVLKLATKFRSMEKYERLWDKFPKIFTAIIKRDMTMANFSVLQNMLRERKLIQEGKVSVDDSMTRMGTYLFEKHTNKEEIEALRREEKKDD
jgi:hypothetical protein